MVNVHIVGEVGAIDPPVDPRGVAVEIKVLEFSSLELRFVVVNLEKIALVCPRPPTIHREEVVAGIKAHLEQAVGIGSCIPVFARVRAEVPGQVY